MFELSEARRDELVAHWAARIVGRGLGSAAVFLLEAHKPVAGIGAQAVVAFQPMIEPFLRIDASELAAFMRDAESVERLIARIEELDEQRRQAKRDRGGPGKPGEPPPPS
jgi:hypothetical protein